MEHVNTGFIYHRIRGELVPVLIEKCLAAPKATMKERALKCILLFMEKDSVEPVIEDLIQGCSKKQPKTVAACYNALSESLKGFGTPMIQPKPILKLLPAAFQHSEKLVRDEVTL
jgi:hypothetical protein